MTAAFFMQIRYSEHCFANLSGYRMKHSMLHYISSKTLRQGHWQCANAIHPMPRFLFLWCSASTFSRCCPFQLGEVGRLWRCEARCTTLCCMEREHPKNKCKCNMRHKTSWRGTCLLSHTPSTGDTCKTIYCL